MLAQLVNAQTVGAAVIFYVLGFLTPAAVQRLRGQAKGEADKLEAEAKGLIQKAQDAVKKP